MRSMSSKSKRLPFSKATILKVISVGKRRGWGDDLRSIIRHLILAKNMTGLSMAKTFNLSPPTMYKLINYCGLKCLLKPGRPENIPTIIDQKDLEELPALEISAKYNIKLSVARREKTNYEKSKNLIRESVRALGGDDEMEGSGSSPGDSEFPWESGVGE